MIKKEKKKENNKSRHHQIFGTRINVDSNLSLSPLFCLPHISI